MSLTSVTRCPAIRRAPAWQARSTRAASRSVRRAEAANWPPDLVPGPGKGSRTWRPLGTATTTSCTGSQLGTPAGSRPRSSSRRNAAVVSPSPQHLSRGKVALSISTTSRPSRASVMAAAVPAGPAPTTATSAAASARRDARAVIYSCWHRVGAGASRPVWSGARSVRGRDDTTGPSGVVSMLSAASVPVQYRAATCSSRRATSAGWLRWAP